MRAVRLLAANPDLWSIVWLFDNIVYHLYINILAILIRKMVNIPHMEKKELRREISKSIGRC